MHSLVKISRAKSKFRQQLDAVGLSQRSFSKLIGVDAMTVNRWCTNRESSLSVPRYAVVFLAVYARLSDAERGAVRVEFGLDVAA